MAHLLAVRELSLVIDGSKLLDGVSLTVQRGQIHAIVGPSGSGKTSLLRAIVRLVEPTGGTVEIGGEDVREIEPRELRSRVGWVPQNPVFTESTVLANALVGFELQDRPVDEKRAHRLLDRVGLGQAHDQPVGELSGGERQRLGLVRTMAVEPDVLLLDEPTANLDRDLEGDVEALIDESVGRQRGCLFVTHAPEQARRRADRVSRIEAGRVTAQGTPGEVLA